MTSSTPAGRSTSPSPPSCQPGRLPGAADRSPRAGAGDGGRQHHRPCLGRRPARTEQPAAALVDVAVRHDRRLRGRLPGALSGPGQRRRARWSWSSRASTTPSRRRRRPTIAPLFATLRGHAGRSSWPRDPKAMAIGERLFANNCATCHGADARGSKGFPNLTDGDWLWGGTPEKHRGDDHQGPPGHDAADGAPRWARPRTCATSPTTC